MRRALFWLCITLFVQSSISSSDFRLFKRNAIATPSVEIHPDSDGNFIYFNDRDKSTIQPYINSINKLLTAYGDVNHTESHRSCDFNNPAPENTVCTFDIVSLNNCSQQDFGYTRAAPCVYFTLRQASKFRMSVS